jgi:glycosyltransferase involved in cell wall biosynthesis
MKVSVCTTVFNEEATIGELIESLLEQESKPGEIIIVDGGSKDHTVDIIRHWQKKYKRIKLLIEPGSIAHGRNVAIDIARYSIIAQIDAGCVAKRDWLEKLIEPFKYREVGLVAGFYEMRAKNSKQRAMNVFHGVMPEQFDPISFLPSARSVAFRKCVWDMVGGYDESLAKAGEDTQFFYKVVKANVKIARVKKARVVWQETAKFTLKDFIKKTYFYAKGDAQARIWWHPSKRFTSHNIKIISIYARYLIVVALLLLRKPLIPFLFLILYTFWSFRKVYILTSDFRVGLWGIIIQFVSDLAVMSGFLSGCRLSKI